MLNMAIRGESDKQTCRAREMLMSAVTITKPSGPLCMRGVRQIIVEEDGPSVDRKAGLGRVGFRGKPASVLPPGPMKSYE
jgi:hypothetical protein